MNSEVIAATYPPHNGTMPNATLSNGISIPLVGLGCASGVRYRHVTSAYEIGYRFFDTAQSFNWGYHEDEVGQALVEHDTTVFIQTKIHPQDLGYHATHQAVQLSLQRLQRTTLDSVLIHKPRCWQGICNHEPEGTWHDSWKALEELVDQGIVKSIGICDVNDQIFNQLLQKRIRPHLIQNYMDPFKQDKRIREQCQQHNILYQAYSTLGTQWKHFSGLGYNPVLIDPTLESLARHYDVSVANVIINWATRLGVSVLPASTNPARQESNLRDSFTFDLSNDDMKVIAALDGQGPKKRDPNLVKVQFENQGKTAIESFWVDDNSKNEVPIGRIEPQQSISMDTYHGHRFVFKKSDVIVGEHLIEKKHGPTQRHVVHKEL